MKYIVLSTGLSLVLGLTSGPAAGQISPDACGSLANATGPFDYLTQRGNELFLVESAHFTPQVEAAIRGERGYLGHDIDYTLRAYPNHHRALVTLQRYEAKLSKIRPVDRVPRPVECYYERAIRWRPNDVVARMLYAQFLYQKARPAEALKQLQTAESLAGDNGLTHHNIGLVYLEGKDYERAREQARRALDLGFERDTLRTQLAARGQWTNVQVPSDPASSATAPTQR